MYRLNLYNEDFLLYTYGNQTVAHVMNECHQREMYTVDTSHVTAAQALAI
jgi:hypothetical protein